MKAKKISAKIVTAAPISISGVDLVSVPNRIGIGPINITPPPLIPLSDELVIKRNIPTNIIPRAIKSR